MLPSGLRARAQRQNDAKRYHYDVCSQAVAPGDFDGRIGRRDDVGPGLVRVELIQQSVFCRAIRRRSGSSFLRPLMPRAYWLCQHRRNISARAYFDRSTVYGAFRHLFNAARRSEDQRHPGLVFHRTAIGKRLRVSTLPSNYTPARTWSKHASLTTMDRRRFGSL